MNARLKRIGVLTVLHASLTLGLIVYAAAAADAEDVAVPGRAVKTQIAASVLLQPGASLWTPWASTHLPDAVEWLVMLANSALWGSAASAVLGWATVRSR